MPRTSPPIVSFNGGELSPRLRGRTDINKYASGCRTMKNFVPLVHGPAVRRPGTIFAADAKNFYSAGVRQTPNVRLIPFIFSVTDSYMLEFGHLYARVCKDHAQLSKSQNVSGCANNGSDLIRVSTAQAHGLLDDDKVTITGVEGCTEANGTWRIDVIDSTHFDLLESVYVHAYTSDGSITSAYQITTPYDEADLDGLKYLQEADTMYITHPDYPPKQFLRYADTNWVIEDMPIKNGPWMDENTIEDVGTNLCVNADMELDGYWSAVGTPTANERSNTQKYHGNYSWKFTVDANGEGIQSHVFTTVTGAMYRWRARVYSSTGKICVKVRQGNDGGYAFIMESTGFPTNEWREFEGYYKETGGGTGAFIQFLSSGTSGTWYIDKVEIFKFEGITLTPDGTTGYINIVASGNYFTADHVGTYIRFYYPLNASEDTPGYAKITTYVSATEVVAEVIQTLSESTQTPNFSEGSFSAKNGYPAAIAFHEQALWLAGTWAEPQTLWRSVVGQYTNFEPGTNASDSLKYKIASEQNQHIRWMASMTNLIIGTTNGEWRLGPQDPSDPIKPDNIKIPQQSAYGCANQDPINLKNAILFIQRLGHPSNKGIKVRELSYNFEADGYVGVDLTLLADHIAEYGIVDWAFQPNPHPIVWACLRNGQLIGLTYEKDQEVFAWHRHELGGSGKVISVAVKPGTYQDELWMVVNRTIGDEDVQYIEYMDDFDWAAYLKTPGATGGATRQHRMYFVDCGKKVSGGSPTKTLSGLSHLAGKTVQILAGGAQYADQAVSAEGTVTIPDLQSSWCVGLGYDSDLEPLGLEVPTNEGTSQGKQKRIHEVAVKFYETIGGWIGPDEGHLDEIITRTTELIGDPPNLYTGDYDMAFPGGYSKNAEILIRQDKPFPMTVICLLPRWSVEDR